MACRALLGSTLTLALSLPASLFPQVTANRRGLKNQLKSLLWRKGGSSSSGGGGSAAGGGVGSSGGSGLDSPHSMPSTPSVAGAAGVAAPSYASGSVESHMRQLSDLALMLGDYETASSTLRLLASDTKSDKAYKAYAGVQEALGAAAVLSGAPPSEASAGYKEALHRYLQVGRHPWRPSGGAAGPLFCQGHSGQRRPTACVQAEVPMLPVYSCLLCMRPSPAASGWPT